MLLVALGAGGCRGAGGTEGDADTPTSTDLVLADTTLVGLLADLHVLDARRSLVRDSAAMQGLRDSLLARRGYDETRLARELDALATAPDLAGVTWLSVQDRVDALLRPSAPALTPPDTAARRIDG